MDYREKRPEKGTGRPNRTGRGNRRRNRYYGKIILLGVMIGFCVLALIEIIYGQAKLRLENERIALEEKNARALQMLENEQNADKPLDTAQGEKVTEPETENSEEITGLTELDAVTRKDSEEADQQPAQSEEGTESDMQAAPEEEKENPDMQIVFLGDSILDNDREYDGVAYLISKECNAKVYNLSMGGTTAALAAGETGDYKNWDSRCLLGVVNVITGRVDPSILDGYKAADLIKECDFTKTDYFVIEYGINDFLAQIPTSRYLPNGDRRNEDEEHTYGGALNQAVRKLRDAYPESKIILIAPHYCQFFNGETFMGDGYTLDYGYGTLIEYARACGYVYEQNKEENVLLYNAFESSGIDAYTADNYLEDGIHLTSEGRHKYAEDLSRRILKDFYPEE